MGGPHRRTPRLGPLVSSSEDSLHQPERASSSSVRPEGLRTPVGGPFGSSVLRQHHHSSVCPSPAAIHHGLVQCHSRRSQSPHMVIGPEWTLHQEVVDQLVHKWPAVIRLFATSLTARLPVYLSPASDSRVAGTDALLQPWDDLQAYAFPPIALIRRVLVSRGPRGTVSVLSSLRSDLRGNCYLTFWYCYQTFPSHCRIKMIC